MAASTLAEVAKLAGVSPATASRVLNGSARTPGQEVSERVRAAAQALGYVANAQAQALARSSTRLIGLIVHDIADPYFSAIARGVQAAARTGQRTVMLATTDGTPAEEQQAAAAFVARRAEAIVIVGSRSTREEDKEANAMLAAELDRYLSNGGQLGVVGHPLVGLGAAQNSSVLQVPNEELARELAITLASHILAASRQGRFILVGGPADLTTSDDRLGGFQQGLASAGITAEQILRVPFSRRGGHQAGERIAELILEGASDTDPHSTVPCIFAANDVMAIGVAAALRERGLRIPRDTLLAGFDDIEWLQDVRPALTTVRLPLEDIGRQVTLRALAGEASTPEDGPEETASIDSLRGRIILRRSTSLST
ncbi:LacI family DNA-binding transcriptional regulator [Psychromicrobium xiongbiense]|uniref:LacI family DNA-binding transcriptional regulator n=1 Tax=Psychromicrobium xiongbiense TaxID=3051184 RepID=UPI0025534C9E|nr:LacI family DNA-binding transcriptional regulator [Psychromicrobium sp. YIM S02556]